MLANIRTTLRPRRTRCRRIVRALVNGGRQSAATATGGTPKVFIIAIYVFTMINRADGDA